MEECWEKLILLTEEKTIINNHYACIFHHAKSSSLYIGWLAKRFLGDDEGFPTALELLCSERKHGMGDNTLKEDKKEEKVFILF